MILEIALALITAQDARPGIVREEFLYEEAPFPECHASTIAEAKEGLVAAWFGGTREGNPDVGIWVARQENGRWSKPVGAADGTEDGPKRYPCWNPVLFQPREGPLLLFYKVGPNPGAWWGRLKTSGDGGRTWSASRRLPEGILGPIKNKPVQLAGGDILSGSSTEHDGWRVHLERSADGGLTWTKTGPINEKDRGAIQPCFLVHPGGRLQILCRDRNGNGNVWTSWSEDGGATWGGLASTGLPNPNSGTDSVTLRDGRHLLVYNHTVRKPPAGQPAGREMLNVAVSGDGRTWKAALVLERSAGEYSYPAVIQARDGLVHATYTWKRRRVKHVVIDPAKLQPRDFAGGKWPE